MVFAVNGGLRLAFIVTLALASGTLTCARSSRRRTTVGATKKEKFTFNIQVSAKRQAPGCENYSGKLRQKW